MRSFLGKVRDILESNNGKWFTLVLLFVFVAIIAGLRSNFISRSDEGKPSPHPISGRFRATAEDPPSPQLRGQAQEVLLEALNNAQSAIITGNRDPREADRVLIELENKMAEAPSDASIAAILSFLNSNKDAETGNPFQVGPDGYLIIAPTFRMILLDLLEKLEGSVAAEYASKIFAESRIAGEWTLALRSQGRHLGVDEARQSSAYRSYVERHLSNHEWLKNPPPGYLYGFDAAVFLGDGEQAARVTNIHLQNHHPATNFAARLALDRMAMEDFLAVVPAALLAAGNHGDVYKERALVISRANPMSTHNMEVVREYLLDPGILLEEKTEFLQSFPNANLEISHDILTPKRFLSMAVVREMDRAAAGILEDWATNPEMREIATSLNNRASEIRRFTETKASN